MRVIILSIIYVALSQATYAQWAVNLEFQVQRMDLPEDKVQGLSSYSESSTYRYEAYSGFHLNVSKKMREHTSMGFEVGYALGRARYGRFSSDQFNPSSSDTTGARIDITHLALGIDYAYWLQSPQDGWYASVQLLGYINLKSNEVQITSNSSGVVQSQIEIDNDKISPFASHLRTEIGYQLLEREKLIFGLFVSNAITVIDFYSADIDNRFWKPGIGGRIGYVF